MGPCSFVTDQWLYFTYGWYTDVVKTLREYVQDAEEKKVAVGHFNVSNLETLWGVIGAARVLEVPVIIGLSEGEGAFFGLRQAKAIIESVREEFNQPIFLNADHSYSFDRFKKAIDARFDSAIFDGAKLSTEQNIEETKKCVVYARSVDPEIVVEGELGYIGSSSKLLDTLPAGVDDSSMTSPEDAKRFVDETGVDFFAPAVGNVHGMLKNMPEPKLDIARIKAIKDACKIPLVLHGASGNTGADVVAAIDAGISVVHINTEVRVAFHDAVLRSLTASPDEMTPYKFMQPAVAAVQEIVTKKLKIFNKL